MVHPTEIDIRYLLRGLWDQLFVIFAYACAGAALALAYLFTASPEYTSTALLRVDPNFGTTTESTFSTGPEAIGTHIESERVFITSDTVLERVVDEKSLIDSDEFGARPGLSDQVMVQIGLAADGEAASPRGRLEETVRNLREVVTVSRIGSSLLIEVTVRSASPDTAADLANAIVAAYISESLASTRATFENLAADLRASLPEALRTLEAEQRGLEEFIEQTAFDLGLETIMMFMADELDNELARTVRLATASGKLTPAESSQIISLWNALNVRQKTYNGLLSGVVEIESRAAAIPPPATVVFAATAPARPVAPNKTLSLAMGLVLGLIVGSARALWRAPKLGYVRSAADVESVNLPTVATIPRHRGGSGSLKDEIAAPKSPFAQAVWRLQTALLSDAAQDDGAEASVIMVTPVRGKAREPGLGFALAASLGSAGFRTVYFGLDPDVPLAPGGTNARLPNLLRADNLAEVETALMELEEPGLVVVQNDGMDREDTRAALFSPWLGEVLVALKTQFDFVVLETASVLETVDATYMAQAADALIVDVGAGKVRRGELQRTHELLQTAGRAESAIMVALSGLRKAKV